MCFLVDLFFLIDFYMKRPIKWNGQNKSESRIFKLSNDISHSLRVLHWAIPPLHLVVLSELKVGVDTKFLEFKPNGQEYYREAIYYEWKQSNAKNFFGLVQH